MFRRAFCALALLCGCSAQAQTFIVNSAGDNNDPVDDLVTLREAIAQANATPGHDTILLPAGIKISTALGYSVTDDVSISGVQGDEAKLISSADTLFELGGDESSVDFENLVLVGEDSLRGVQACGVVTASNIAASGFSYAFDLCEYSVDLHISQSSFIDNGHFLNGNFLNKGNTATALVERSYIENSGMFVRGYDADVNVEIRRSLYIAEKAYLRINGSTSLLIKDSALLLSNRGSLLTATYDSRRPAGSSRSNYYYPNLEIVQSTIAGNQSDYPVITTQGAAVRIAHSTLADNANNNGHLLELKGYREFSSGDVHGSVLIDHTVIDRFYSDDTPILLSQADLQARYSFIPVIEKGLGTERAILDSTSSLYQGAPAYLGDLVIGLANLPYYLPQPGSPVVDAGDASAVAGENGVPALEQRLSARVLGGVIDVGGTEFNREPILDEEALRAEYDAQVKALSESNEEIEQGLEVIVIAPDDIVLDLDYFVSDPDGHAINHILFFSEADLEFAPGSNTLYGKKEAFKDSVMQVMIFEETGLATLQEVDWRPKTTSAKAANSSGGGGSLPLTILGAIALLGMWRTRQRRVLEKP
ncbi:hypothetical protein [Alcanivorax jadensis]|uniref:hypothetical protein n=1 Tax=Alcanivorax jadensis TaxID=64988 RepID=UPI0035668039